MPKRKKTNTFISGKTNGALVIALVFGLVGAYIITVSLAAPDNPVNTTSNGSPVSIAPADNIPSTDDLLPGEDDGTNGNPNGGGSGTNSTNNSPSPTSGSNKKSTSPETSNATEETTPPEEEHANITTEDNEEELATADDSSSESNEASQKISIVRPLLFTLGVATIGASGAIAYYNVLRPKSKKNSRTKTKSPVNRLLKIIKR